ncbi:MAG: YebC/PmpR family DNA-binding transcriptional regulator [Proteobacteria bacterium]|nr:YebC/PmpR family DNA-binding transcriptional regulator [Pseudomonadota bacterium]
MAGHSKWANIKHRKAAQDKKRGKIFTRLIREIMTAARHGGGDIASNPGLRLAVDGARAENMPKDTIERAIKRGTGEIEGADYVEVVYEGYGPGNVAMMVKCLTDNKTRTVANVRAAFGKNGGRFGEAVAWMFDQKGIILYPSSIGAEDDVMEAAIEAGADDVIVEAEGYEVHTAIEDFATVRDALEAKFGKAEEADLGFIAKNETPITDEEKATTLMKLVNALEDDDDVQSVTTNADFDDAVMQAMAS